MVLRSLLVFTAITAAACGEIAPTSASSSTPASTPTQTASPLAEPMVQALVQKVYPTNATGTCATPAGGIDNVGNCPFSDRLKSQLTRLETQTPFPTGQGDLCNFSLVSGTQGGLSAPVHATVILSGDHASAAISAGTQTVVTLTVIQSSGQAIVDDITYNSAMNGRSIYTLSCSGTFGH